MKRLLNLFCNRIADDQGATLDHVPVRKRKDRDWRDAAVKKAAAKYGKPFKCSSETMRREVMVGPDKIAIAEAGALPARTEPAPVSIFKREMNK